MKTDENRYNLVLTLPGKISPKCVKPGFLITPDNFISSAILKSWHQPAMLLV